MALGQLQAKDVMVLGDGRDRLARQDDRPLGDWHAQHTAPARRQHRALLHLLEEDVAIGVHRLERALGDIQRRLRGVDLHLGVDAALLQLERPIVISLRLVALGLLRLDAGIERLRLQGQAFRSATTAISAPSATRSPSLMESDAMVPPMRARAVNSCTGSTVATIAFSVGRVGLMNDEGLGDRWQRRRHGDGQTQCEAHIRFLRQGS